MLYRSLVSCVALSLSFGSLYAQNSPADEPPAAKQKAAEQSSPEQAAKMVDTLFGSEFKKVLATRTHTDDIELAKSMLEAAELSRDNQSLALLLSQKSYEFGSKHPDGYTIAIAATDLAMDVMPERRLLFYEKQLPLRQRIFDKATLSDKKALAEPLIDDYIAITDEQIKAGDYPAALRSAMLGLNVANAAKPDRRQEVQDELARVRHLQKVNNQIESFKKLLTVKPDHPTAAGQLIDLYFVELDQPKNAIPYAELAGDDTDKRLIPLATQSHTSLKTADLLAIGEYYLNHAEEASEFAEPVMLTKSHLYLNHLVENTKDPNPLILTKAKILLTSVEKQLIALGITPQTGNKIFDLMPSGDPAFAKVGEWKKTTGQFTLEGPLKFANFPFPRTTAGSYSFTTKITRESNGGMLAIAFPVKNHHTAILLNWGNRNGFDTIRGQRIFQREKGFTTNWKIPSNKPFEITVDVDVRPDEVAVKVSAGKQVLARYLGNPAGLAAHQSLNAPHKSFAITAHRAKVTIHDMKVTIKSGELATLDLAAAMAKPKTRAEKRAEKRAEQREKVASDTTARQGLVTLMKVDSSQARAAIAKMSKAEKKRIADQIRSIKDRNERLKVIRHTGIRPHLHQ